MALEFVEDLDHLREVSQRSGQPVDLVDDHHVDQVPLHHLGREKRQPYNPTDVLLADSVAPGDLDHRSATHEIVEPAVCTRHRSEQRLIGFASRPAVDYESKLNTPPLICIGT